MVVGMGLAFVIAGCKKDLSPICQEASEKSCSKFEKGTDLQDLCYDGFEHYTDEQCQESLNVVDELDALPPLSPIKPATTKP